MVRVRGNSNSDGTGRLSPPAIWSIHESVLVKPAVLHDADEALVRRDRPYFRPVGDYPAGYVGYPATAVEQALGTIDWAFANDVQIITHANGEAAIDLLVAALDRAEAKHGPADRRPVLTHGQFTREDQVDACKRLGIPFTSHHDAPVAFPDSMRVLDATVTRRARSGDIIGPDQRLDVITALKSMTLWSAYQHFEEEHKGSIEAGKVADLVILSGDPTAIDPENLDQLEVVETIKEGVTIYRGDHAPSPEAEVKR